MKKYVIISILILCTSTLQQTVPMNVKLQGAARLFKATEEGDLQAVKQFVKKGGANQKDSLGFTPLMVASFQGYPEIVTYLIDSGAHINDVNSKGETALIFAAQNGHEDIVTKLLSVNADCTIASVEDGVTALIMAAQNGHAPTVEKLLKAAPQVNAVCHDGCTALLAAADKGHDIVVQLLLKYGANVESTMKTTVQTKDGPKSIDVTALDIAAARGYEATVKVLLEHGVKLLKQDGKLCNAFSQSNDSSAAIRDMLEKALETRCSVCSSSKTKPCGGCKKTFYCGQTCQKADWKNHKNTCLSIQNNKYVIVNVPNSLVSAAAIGDLTKVRLLLQQGFNKDEVSSGFTALMIASQNRHAEVVRELLSAGAKVSMRDATGATALQLAAQSGDDSIVELLLDAGADINAANEQRATALIVATCYDNAEVVKLLLAKHASVDLPDHHGCTALLMASNFGRMQIMELLLEAYAAVDATNKNGDTALIVASLEGHESIVKLLLNAGAQIDFRGFSQRTALLAAAQNGHDSIVRLLLDHHANIEAKQEITKLKKNSTESPGEASALDVAVQGGHKSTVKLLLEHGIKLFNSDEEECLAFAIVRDPEIEDMLEKALEKRCSLCSLSKTMTCSGCMETYYCSSDCQKEDWPNHKTECRIRQKRSKEHQELALYKGN